MGYIIISHFWDIEEAAAIRIAELDAKGPTYSSEDLVWHAWSHILGVYFPTRAPAGQPAGMRYEIDREAYRGLPPVGGFQHKPDVVVVRISNVQQAQAGQRPTSVKRDLLWVECKAPDHSAPNGWKNVMEEALVRLEHAHGRNASGGPRRVFFVLAIGMFWMPFLYDPTQPANSNPTPLHILKADGNVWTVHSDVYAVPGLAGATHIFAAQNGALLVDTRRAYCLDYWSIDQQQNVRYAAELQLLETFLLNVQATPVAGVNPPSFG